MWILLHGRLVVRVYLRRKLGLWIPRTCRILGITKACIAILRLEHLLGWLLLLVITDKVENVVPIYRLAWLAEMLWAWDDKAISSSWSKTVDVIC